MKTNGMGPNQKVITDPYFFEYLIISILGCLFVPRNATYLTLHYIYKNSINYIKCVITSKKCMNFNCEIYCNYTVVILYILRLETPTG